MIVTAPLTRKSGQRVFGALLACTSAATVWTILGIRRAGNLSSESGADTLVVFGALVGPSGAGQALRARVERAAAIRFADGAGRIVCSGTPRETEVMRHLLLEHGVPSAVVVEQYAMSTRDTIASLTSVAQHWGDIAVVSSPYHMRRILSEARRHGIFVLPAPSRAEWPCPDGSFFRRHLSSSLGRQYLREVVANWWYSLTWFPSPRRNTARKSVR